MAFHFLAHCRALCQSVAVLAILSGSPGNIFAAESTIVTGKVVSTVTRSAPMPFNAIVDEVLVKPGDAVDEGAPLLRYHLQDEAERILQREVIAGSGNEALKSQVLDMHRQMAKLIAERNKARQLVASGLGSRQALARLEDDVKSLQSRIELINTTIKKNESIFEARLKELSSYYGTEIKEGDPLPSSLVLTSPLSGYVLSVWPINPGSELAAGNAPINVGQLDSVLIQVPVYESEVIGIKEGDMATVEIPSLDNKKFLGKVNEISWASDDMNVGNPSYYTVEIGVPNPDLELKPGFKAVVRFGGK